MAMRWYTVSVLSNFEKRVAESIRETAEKKNLSDQIGDIRVPTEEVIEVRRNKKVAVERRFMPGYVLIQAELTDQIYHLIMDTNRVTGFLGPQGKPLPMRDAEVARILDKVETDGEPVKPTILYDIGEEVRVVDGPFEGFSGMVEEVDVDNARLKVMVSIFGRATPVELEYGQVHKGA